MISTDRIYYWSHNYRNKLYCLSIGDCDKPEGCKTVGSNELFIHKGIRGWGHDKIIPKLLFANALMSSAIFLQHSLSQSFDDDLITFGIIPVGYINLFPKWCFTNNCLCWCNDCVRWAGYCSCCCLCSSRRTGERITCSK